MWPCNLLCFFVGVVEEHEDMKCRAQNDNYVRIFNVALFIFKEPIGALTLHSDEREIFTEMLNLAWGPRSTNLEQLYIILDYILIHPF